MKRRQPPTRPAEADLSLESEFREALAPRRGSRPAPSRRRSLAVAKALEAWRRELVELGGTSALADLTRLGEAALDLTAAHPSGIAQLYAGRTTRLTNLVREGAALAQARRSARVVRARAEDLAHRYGIAPTYLTVGVATWTALPDHRRPDFSEDGAVELDPSADPTSTLSDLSPVPAASPGGPASPAEATSASSAEPASAASADAPPSPEPPHVRVVHAPVLLRPVRLEPHAGPEPDFAIDLEPAVEINPVLVSALRAAGAAVDVAALTRAAFTDHGFSPRTALGLITELARERLPGFEMSERIVLGPFVHPGQILVDDLDALRPRLAASDVVAALAGDDDARQQLARVLPEPVRADRAPDEERGAGDLDPVQLDAIDAVTTGSHVFLDAPPGADVAGTLAGIVADAAASGRRVLYLPGTRRVGRALAQRLEELGLGELVLDLSTDARWRSTAAQRLRDGLSPEEVDLDDEAVGAVRAELTAVRERLRSYVEGLHAVRDPWGVSAYDALQALAELTAERPGPRTRVRLGEPALRRLQAEGLDVARELLVRAAALGAFSLRPHDTPWYGARLTSAAGASEALERTQRLAEIGLPELQAQVERVVEQTGLERATSLRQWLEQLRMLDGVRDCLDVFQPVIFERSAADMVIATASRQWRKEHSLAMRGSVRRRLRKQARDMLRPGRPVEDLHAELVKVQEQREIWRRYCPAGTWPRLPDGMAQIERTAEEVRADVEALQGVVGGRAGGPDLLGMPLDELRDRMTALGRDSAALRLLPERTQVVADLRERGLGELVDDLAERRVPGTLVGAELDLARWASVLEQILRSTPALAGMDGPRLTALADRFRELDAAQVASLAGPVRRAVARSLAETLRRRREEAARLHAALDVDRGGALKETLAAHPELVGAARPVWMVAPMLVPQVLPADREVDLVIVDGAQHLPVAQALSALGRARQVVLVGDSRRGGEGLVGALAPLLPSITLPTGRTQREEGVAAFLSQHGYGGVIRSVPAPAAGSGMRLERVEGYGMPAPGAQTVESVQEEVDRVVDLVLEHALTRPEESLAVVALNARHAARVREAVTLAAGDSPALAEFFRSDRPEPFTVVEVDAASGLRRDTILLSVGYGKTPHGRVLHRFGAVSGPDGVGALTDALDAVRHHLILVSCIGPGDLDRERLRQPGALLLADLIDAAAAGGLPVEQASGDVETEPDRLLVDLAERLWRLGLTVVPNYGTAGGVRIPLAIGHPDLGGELAVAVLTDDAEYVAEPSLRRRDRHWIERLVARGWVVHMAFSTAVFMDPQAEAETILGEVMAVVTERRAAQQRALPAGADVPAELEEDDAEPDVADAESLETVPTPPARGPRPAVVPGLPLAAYSDDQLDELLGWIVSDGVDRDEAQLIDELRRELALTRRGAQVDAVLANVVRRRRG